MIVSPFEHLQMPRELVCEFFGVFSRFEFTLKELNFFRSSHNSRAAPDWQHFGEKFGELLPTEITNSEAIQYLLKQPPFVQEVENGSIHWKAVPLRGSTDGERAIDAIQRVRNNLFHGGKHSSHSPKGRDEKLVRGALIVLEACIVLNKDFQFCYENSKF